MRYNIWVTQDRGTGMSMARFAQGYGRTFAALVALSLLATGCGESPDTQPAPASQAATAAPPSAPAALTLAQAKDRYLKIVTPYNTALEDLETAANAGKSWTTVRVLAGKVATANAQHAAALRATTWPAEVREPMAELLAETDAAQREWQRAAQAKTVEELGAAIRSAAAHSGTKPATEIRGKLGLPPYRES
jgi:hypothetical protein